MRAAGSVGSRPGCSRSTRRGSKLALIGIDLLAYARTLLLDGEHVLAEPKKLRYRLLHVAARLVRTARRTYLRIARRWPWAQDLPDAFARLDALPRPIG
jgi:hypothetical protein